jgi:hypothetical protein
MHEIDAEGLADDIDGQNEEPAEGPDETAIDSEPYDQDPPRRYRSLSDLGRPNESSADSF